MKAGKSKRVYVVTPGLADPVNLVGPAGAPSGSPQTLDPEARSALRLAATSELERYAQNQRMSRGWRPGPVLTSLLDMRAHDRPWRPDEVWLVYEDDRDTELNGELHARVEMLCDTLSAIGTACRSLPLCLNNQDPVRCELTLRATVRHLLDVQGVVTGQAATEEDLAQAAESGFILPRGVGLWRHHLAETAAAPPTEIRILTGIATNALRIGTLMLGLSLGAALPPEERLLTIELWHPVDRTAQAAHGSRTESAPWAAPLRFGDEGLPRLLTDEIARALVRRAERSGGEAPRNDSEGRRMRARQAQRAIEALVEGGSWPIGGAGGRAHFKSLVLQRLAEEGLELPVKTLEDYATDRLLRWPWQRDR